MRRILALSLLLAVSVPLSAQEELPATHGELQTCLTWLSLALRFGPEGQHAAIEEQYLQLNGAVAARADVSEEQKRRQSDLATEAYDNWVLDHFNANDATKATMLADVLAKASECETTVPAEPAAPAQ